MSISMFTATHRASFPTDGLIAHL